MMKEVDLRPNSSLLGLGHRADLNPIISVLPNACENKADRYSLRKVSIRLRSLSNLPGANLARKLKSTSKRGSNDNAGDELFHCNDKNNICVRKCGWLLPVYAHHHSFITLIVRLIRVNMGKPTYSAHISARQLLV